MAIGADPRPKRFRLLVVNGYEVAPLTSGGQRRIRDVYAALVPFLDVELVTLARNPLHGGIRGLAPGLVEFSVPRSWPQHEAAARLTSELGERAEHAALPQLAGLNPAFEEALRLRLRRADAVAVCHPYLFEYVASLWSGPIIYHSHDVEAIVQRDMIPHTPQGDALYEAAVAAERSCVERAASILAMSREDALAYCERYAIAVEKCFVLPPSFDMRDAVFTTPQMRREAKRRWTEEPVPFAIFMGSTWGPNLQGVKEILTLAARMPRLRFVVLGDVRAAFPREYRFPANVVLTGYVPEELKTQLLRAADVALNPTCSRSGVNMKMGEYFAAGTPVVTTPSGARGLDISQEHAVIVPPADFAGAIEDVLSDAEAADSRARAAFEHARARFDAAKNARALAAHLTEALAVG